MDKSVGAILVGLFAFCSCSDQNSPTLSMSTTSEKAADLSAHSFLTWTNHCFLEPSPGQRNSVLLEIDGQQIVIDFILPPESGFVGCSGAIDLTAKSVFLDEEELTLSEFTERMRVYAESARLTESIPMFYLNASENANLLQLFEIFSILEQHKISTIRLSALNMEENQGLQKKHPYARQIPAPPRQPVRLTE